MFFSTCAFHWKSWNGIRSISVRINRAWKFKRPVVGHSRDVSELPFHFEMKCCMCDVLMEEQTLCDLLLVAGESRRDGIRV